MKSLISILLSSILLAKAAEAAQKPIVIAVVDTGYSQASYAPSPRFCRFGHADLSGSDLNLHKIPEDNNGHGTHIVHTIEKQLLNAPEGSYCIVVLKYFDTSAKSSEQQNIKNSIAAFNLATKMHVDFVNYSSAGEKADPSEELAVKKMLDSGIKLVVAAGNLGKLVVADRRLAAMATSDKVSETYPGNYDRRIAVVGNLASPSGERTQSSNWGPRVEFWEVGTNVEAGGVKMTGTSQAAAVYTGKIANNLINRK